MPRAAVAVVASTTCGPYLVPVVVVANVLDTSCVNLLTRPLTLTGPTRRATQAMTTMMMLVEAIAKSDVCVIVAIPLLIGISKFKQYVCLQRLIDCRKDAECLIICEGLLGGLAVWGSTQTYRRLLETQCFGGFGFSNTTQTTQDSFH